MRPLASNSASGTGSSTRAPLPAPAQRVNSSQASSTSRSASDAPLPISRRQVVTLLQSFALLSAASLPALPAHAIRTLTAPDGSSVEAFEFDIDLKIAAVKNSVPQAYLNDFRQLAGRGAKVYLEQKASYSELLTELRKPSLSLPEPSDDMKYSPPLPDRMTRPTAHADLVSLGDQWVAAAIRENLIRPFPNAEKMRWYQNLDGRWRQLCKRNPQTGLCDPNGQVYGVPYRWGCSLIAYNKKQLLQKGGRPIETWSDLLQPQLKGKVGFLDSTRDFGGVVMKTFGLSFNATETDLKRAGVTVADLKRRCAQLRSQLLLVSDKDHVRAIQVGDALAIVGNSTDLYPVGQRMNEVDLVAPLDGTSLWADLWTVPARATGGNRKAGPSPLVPVWVDYCLQPQRARVGLGLAQGGAAPPLLPPPGASLPASDSSVMSGNMPAERSLRNSEFLLPLDDAMLGVYRQMLLP